ncbi:hypothetical protein CI238_12588 [Colletotrichum incanum]|uniref:Uncharacterized protein n=1 Tax=Colletotrichum incanum TaxID=1573173 RepID=A0A167BF53_COLIC|nr:hypothetical protein CI238_12588 [Colletotrichum incanum]
MCTLGKRYYERCDHWFWTVSDWCEQKKRHKDTPGLVRDCKHFVHDWSILIESPPEEAHKKCPIGITAHQKRCFR